MVPAKGAMSVMRAAKLACLLALSTALSLSACGQQADQADIAKLDNQIIANDADPALTSALEDQILVDPALTQQSNKNAVRSPASPPQAQYPLSAEEGPANAAAPQGASDGQARRAAQTASASAGTGAAGADCAPELNYDRAWASRLPAAFAIYPGARVTEAAGNDRGGCRARVVTFTTAAAPQQVLDHYRGRAVRAGYSAEHQMREGDHILAGTAAGSDAAFYLILTPLRGGGSDVAMITNGG